MASRKADFDGLLVQDFLTKAQAMAYTLRLSEDKFNTEIAPYVHVYRAGKGGCYYLPELRKRMLDMVEIIPSRINN